MNGSKTEVGGVTNIAGVNQVILFEFYPNSSPKGIWQLGTFFKRNFFNNSRWKLRWGYISCEANYSINWLWYERKLYFPIKLMNFNLK